MRKTRRLARRSTTSSPRTSDPASTTSTAARSRSIASRTTRICARGHEDRVGVRFVLPVTAGFFDFSPVDVISEGPPTRVDSFSVVPGIELDHQMANDWHFIPYVRAGFSLASSSVDGWLYGTGFRLERREKPTVGMLSFAPNSPTPA